MRISPQAVPLQDPARNERGPRCRATQDGRLRGRAHEDIPGMAPPPAAAHRPALARRRQDGARLYRARPAAGCEELPYVELPPVAARALQRRGAGRTVGGGAGMGRGPPRGGRPE